MKQLKNLIDLTNLPPKQKWGNWIYDSKTNHLCYYKGKACIYPINLNNKNTNSKILDLIFQINTKNWSKDAMHDLIQALNDIFQPQAHCCSFGQNKTFKSQTLCEMYNNRLLGIN